LDDKNKDVAMEAARSGPEMTPRRAIETLEGGLGLGGGELAGALGASVRTVERWRTGQTYPQHESRERLADLVAVEHRLGETFANPEAGRAWLHSSNPYLGGLTPLEALLAGRSDRVEAALEALDSGVFV
jgi:DNA-binding transcriptional regulator YiaG